RRHTRFSRDWSSDVCSSDLPVGMDDVAGEGLWSIVVALLINTCISVIALLKGKIWTGVIGVFIGVIALVGAVRLARPDSPWARRRYAPGSRKERWARKREQRYRRPVQRLGDRLSDLVAGRPTGE